MIEKIRRLAKTKTAVWGALNVLAGALLWIVTEEREQGMTMITIGIGLIAGRDAIVKLEDRE